MLNIEKLYRRLLDENPHWNRIYALQGVSEYNRFILLKWLSDTPENLSPSPEIDVIWHCHLLDNEDYRMMEVTLKKHIIHNPLGVKSSPQEREERYRHTLESYKRLFGAPINPAFWPAPIPKPIYAEVVSIPFNAPTVVQAAPVQVPLLPNTRYRKRKTLEAAAAGVPIYVKNLLGKILTPRVHLDDTVESLKQKIHSMDGICPDQQRLIYAGKQLEDQRTLQDSGVTPGCTLHLILRLRGC